ncbi:MAG: ArsR family transcriptional regulator [Planctomycetaceae bacterium]|nr:MAG: ArsR family transcriptional regulator [Planctomycetaceae bacterium]
MAKHNQIDSLASMFRVLGDQTRLRVLMTLKRGDMNVSELCAALRVPQPTISRHLSIMRMAGLVSNRREGKEIFYSLGNPANVKILRGILAIAGR